MKLVIRPNAREDIRRHVRYLLKEFAFDAAERFPHAVREAFSQVLENPGVGNPREFANSRLQGLRSWPVPGFDTTRIYYLVQGSTLRVIRVLHGRRDLGSILEIED